MRNLLYVNASPRGEKSESRAIADAFLAEVLEREPDTPLDVMDLWSEPLPVFGGQGVEAKMTVFAGQEPTGDAGDAWDQARAVYERFAAADDYLFTVPMWNHSVPWVLKHLIDTVSQPGMLFGFDPEHGYTGLLRGRRAVSIYTGAVWWDGAPLAFGQDFHRSYFDDWLRWAGVEDRQEVRFQPNLVTSDAEGGRRRALAAARELGARFAAGPLLAAA